MNQTWSMLILGLLCVLADFVLCADQLSINLLFELRICFPFKHSKALVATMILSLIFVFFIIGFSLIFSSLSRDILERKVSTSLSSDS